MGGGGVSWKKNMLSYGGGISLKGRYDINVMVSATVYTISPARYTVERINAEWSATTNTSLCLNSKDQWEMQIASLYSGHAPYSHEGCCCLRPITSEHRFWQFSGLYIFLRVSSKQFPAKKCQWPEMSNPESSLFSDLESFHKS